MCGRRTCTIAAKVRVYVTHEYHSRRTAETSSSEDQNRHGGTTQPLDISVLRQLHYSYCKLRKPKDQLRTQLAARVTVRHAWQSLAFSKSVDASPCGMRSGSLNVAAIHIENPTLAAPTKPYATAHPSEVTLRSPWLAVQSTIQRQIGNEDEPENGNLAVVHEYWD